MQLYLLCPKQLDQRTYHPHPTQEYGYLQVHLTSVIHETSWMASNTSSTKVPTNHLTCETLTLDSRKFVSYWRRDASTPQSISIRRSLHLHTWEFS